MEFLTEIDFSELTTTGVATLMILVFTVVGFIRGAVRLVFMLFSLAGAGYAAYWGAEVGFVKAQANWAAAPAWLSDVLALGCGVITLILLLKIFKFFIDPFETSNFVGRFVFGVPAAIISLVAAVALIWGSLVFLHDKGTQSEIRYWLAQDDIETRDNVEIKVEGEGEVVNEVERSYSRLAKAKQLFESSIIGKPMMSFYQIKEGEESHLAKLLIIAKNSPEKMASMADNAAVRGLFDNPHMTELLEDETVTQLIKDDNYDGLLSFFFHDRTLTRSQLRSDLEKIEVEDLR